MASVSGRVVGRLCALVAALLAAGCGSEPDARIAVATNFHDVATVLAAGYSAESGDELGLVAGSTGKLYAQIVAGAPFHAFLAADEARPLKLVENGIGVAGSDFVYASGRLCLWSPVVGDSVDGAGTLQQGDYDRLAIANPELAPYGAAARQVLESLAARERAESRLVVGENIGQAYALVATGNADFGLIALAQLRRPGTTARACPWLVPAKLHEPIRQRAVLLAHASGNSAARGFLDYLDSPAARDIIRTAGYDLD